MKFIFYKGLKRLGVALVTILTLGIAAPMGMTPALALPSPEPPDNRNVNKMYRLYNPNSGEHFYTKDKNERKNVLAAGWNDEGIGWYAPEVGQDVYRLYNKNAGEHHYTLDAKEKDNLVRVGWTYEGVGWKSMPAEKGEPIYRQYNPNAFANNHNYTTSLSEKNHLISLGWKDEKIGWYGAKGYWKKEKTGGGAVTENVMVHTGEYYYIDENGDWIDLKDGEEPPNGLLKIEKTRVDVIPTGEWEPEKYTEYFMWDLYPYQFYH